MPKCNGKRSDQHIHPENIIMSSGYLISIENYIKTNIGSFIITAKW